MNEPITTIIVDDEAAGIKMLRTDLELCQGIKIINTFTSVEKAKKAILKQQPHLLFIDVEMPEMKGTESLQELSDYFHSNMCIVFCSTQEKHLIDALRMSAFDFLLKPYKLEDLLQIIGRVKHKFTTNNIRFEHSIRKLLSDDRKFALQIVTGLLMLKRSEVIYFQYNSYLRSWQIFLTEERVFKLRTNMTAKDILNISLSFFQVNQDVIINIDYMTSIDMSYHCILRHPYNNLNIIVSRRYYSKLKEALEII